MCAQPARPTTCGELRWMTDERAGADEVAEVERWSDVYEAALVRHDVTTLNELFWDDPGVLRFGIADWQRGHGALVAWRATSPQISPGRVITERHVVALAPGVVAVDLLFADDEVSVGRQSQTWIRTGGGWRIARAHVSVIPAS